MWIGLEMSLEGGDCGRSVECQPASDSTHRAATERENDLDPKVVPTHNMRRGVSNSPFGAERR